MAQFFNSSLFSMVSLILKITLLKINKTFWRQINYIHLPMYKKELHIISNMLLNLSQPNVIRCIIVN